MLPISSETTGFSFHLRSDLHLVRKFWHICTGLLGLAIYHSIGVNQHSMATGLFLFSLGFFVFETLRLRTPALNRRALVIMRPFMRDYERTSYTGLPFYALGVSLSLFLYEEKIAILSIMFLVFADPISSFFGIKYGKDKIFGNKSLQGALAGMLTCYLLALFYGLNNSSVGGFDLLAFSILAGVVGSASELLSVKIDDNLTIPIVSGLGLTFLNLIFHIY